MNNHLCRFVYIYLTLSLLSTSLYGQTIIHGSIKDINTDETLVGVNIHIEKTSIGGLSDFDGRFSFESPIPTPFTISVDYFGYDTLKWLVEDHQQPLNLYLIPSNIGEDFSSASGQRNEALILGSPDPIKKLDFMDIMMNPLPDFYTGLASLEGVQAYHASVGLTTINTRGFATLFNNRITQLVDGVDVSTPGYDAPISNSLGPTDLDIVQATLIEGPGSAVYNANAFNGILQVSTRDPEEYPGISAYVKQGVTLLEGIGQRPFTDVGLRYAFSTNKFSAKFSASYLNAREWVGTTTLDREEKQTVPSDLLELILNDLGNTNVVGDLTALPFSDTTFINRTGFREFNLITDNVENIRSSVYFQYKLTDKVKLKYEGKISRIDYINRTVNPTFVDNESTTLQRLELSGENFLLRSYYTKVFGGKAINLENLANEIQGRFTSNEMWLNRYRNAWEGNIEGISAGDPIRARGFADLDIPDENSQDFRAVRQEVVDSFDSSFPQLGSRNRSSFWHIEGQWDLAPNLLSLPSQMTIQIGGSFRTYTLRSEGSIFNDGPKSVFADGIPIWKAGAYALVSHRLMDNRLTLFGSLRFDDHQDFELRVSPRVAATLQLDQEGFHFLRLQFKSGFRTPVSTEMFALEGGGSVTSPLTVGSVARNLEALNLAGTSDNQFIDNLVTVDSYNAFLASSNPDPRTLVSANAEQVKQERITTIDFGYRSLINNKLYLQSNAYLSIYDDFTRTALAISPDLVEPVLITTNFTDSFLGWGLSGKFEYNFIDTYKISGSYSYTDVNIDTSIDPTDENLANTTVPNFNAPKHMLHIGLNNRDVYRGLGFSAQYRWWDEFDFNFYTIFRENIPSKGLVDLAITMKLPDKPILFKVGGNNILNDHYISIFNGPTLGASYYVSITFDKFFW